MASPVEVLDRRETRRDEQVRLLGLASTVISVSIVSPGADKDDHVARTACAAAVDAVRCVVVGRGWPLVAERSASGASGPEFLAAVDAPASEVKAALSELEDNTPRGRLWDLDVVTGPVGGQPVAMSRRDLGRPGRRCLVCALDAAGCARSRRHHPLLVWAARAALAAGCVDGRAEAVAELAVGALMREARLTPKPGLVDAASSGAHDDMDLALLERSAEALRPWFAACYRAGVACGPDAELRERLVEVGLAAEAQMRAVTGGVNTHKGGLFALGLLAGALGRLEARTHEQSALDLECGADRAFVGVERALVVVEPVCSLVGDLATPLLAGWLARPDASHGSSALRALGLTGARGEAAGGFATARRVGLPAYRARLAETGDADDAARWTLLHLMAVNDDTNLVARGGSGGLAFVRAWAADLAGRHPEPGALVAALAAVEDAFVERRLSPGGSADLLAVSLFLDGLASGLARGHGPG